MNFLYLSKYIFLATMFQLLSICSFAQNEDSIAQQNNFYVDGSFSGKTTKAIILSYIDSKGVSYNDKSSIIDGRFHFSGNINEPTLVSFSAGNFNESNYKNNVANVFIEPAHMTIKLREDHYDSLEMTGSKTQQEYISLKNVYANNNRQIDLSDTLMNVLNDSARALKKKRLSISNVQNDRLALAKKIDSLRSNPQTIDFDYITQHPNSYVSAYILGNRYKVYHADKATVSQYYHQLTHLIQKSYLGTELNNWLTGILLVNTQFPDKQFADTKGAVKNIHSLLNDNYTLVIFWASWCMPCRRLNATYKKIYNTYHEKGLNVIAITFDHLKNNWLTAIKQDQTSMWLHLSLKNMEDAKYYKWEDDFGLNFIPAEILLKKDTIIGKYAGASNDNQGIEDLQNKLKEIYK